MGRGASDRRAPVAAGAEWVWEDASLRYSGRSNILEHVMMSVRAIPDLRTDIIEVAREGPASLAVDLCCSGTQATMYLPHWPIRKFVSWRLRSVVTFDSQLHITRKHVRLLLEEKLGLQPQMLEGLSNCARALASTPSGCRVLQRAIEEPGAGDCGCLVEQLRGHVWEAAASPHANHVLQKLIANVHPARVRFVAEEFRGRAAAAARHRVRGRVIERLLEHAPAEHLGDLVEELLDACSDLCHHAFGNFVVQRLLEHGTAKQRHRLAACLAADAARMAKSKIGSSVLRCALVHCAGEDRARLAGALEADPSRAEELNRHLFGGFVMREVRRLRRNGALPDGAPGGAIGGA
uniref:PUM-HD domain-containing protein n=1 Tax=Zooxanthella nutricula TaxID=1333877 RepID=A0A7S2NNT8_9DINO